MSAIGSVIGGVLAGQVAGGGLGALEDVVGAIESVLSGGSDASKQAGSLKDALKAFTKFDFGDGFEKGGGALKDAFDALEDLEKGGGTLKDAFDAIRHLEKGALDAVLDPSKKAFGV
jgi:hypothetical protein